MQNLPIMELINKITNDAISQISKKNLRIVEMQNAICASILAGALFGFYSLVPIFSIPAGVFFFLGIVILGGYLIVSSIIFQEISVLEKIWGKRVQNEGYTNSLDYYIKENLTAQIAPSNSKDSTQRTKITKCKLIYFNYMFWVGIGCAAFSGIFLSVSVFTTKTPYTNSIIETSDCIQLHIDSIQINHKTAIDALKIDIDKLLQQLQSKDSTIFDLKEKLNKIPSPHGQQSQHVHNKGKNESSPDI